MLWLDAVFDYSGLVLVNFFLLEDIYCLFRTSRCFNAFLHHLLDGIAHSNKKTVGSGFDGRLTSYVRWIFPDVPCFSYCLHAGINAGNIFDLAKIAYFKPLHEIKISIGDGSSSLEFFKVLCDFNDSRQEKIRGKQVGRRLNIKSTSLVNIFRLMMDSRCDGYYYIHTIACVFPNLVELDLVDAENIAAVTETESLVQSFASFRNLRSLNITGNFDLSSEKIFIRPQLVNIFNVCLIQFSVQHNNKINNIFFDILATFALNLQSVSILDCSNVTVNCLTFLSLCKMISFVHVPRSFNDDINIQAFTAKFRNACIVSFH
jgi:hypothetical protein